MSKIGSSGQSGCIWATLVLFRQNGCTDLGNIGLYLGQMVVFGQNWFYLVKIDFIWANMVLFGQNWFYLGKIFECFFHRYKSIWIKSRSIDRIAILAEKQNWYEGKSETN